MDIVPLLSQEYFHNSLRAYLTALAAFLILLPIFSVLHSRLLTSVKIPHTVHWLLSLYLIAPFLTVPIALLKTLNILLVVSAFFWATGVANQLLETVLSKLQGTNRGEKGSAHFALSLLIKLALWSTGVLLILANLGINISALVASLGIGGIAVALAVQNILSDIFSSVSIHMDKPFEIDDFITVGDASGTVEKIGLKTTRLRALTGEEIVISNRELTSVRLHNHKRMKKRRLSFTLNISPETSTSKLKLIPGIIKKVAKDVKGMELDDVFFKSIGIAGMEYEVAYFIDMNDGGKLSSIQHKLNLGIVEGLAEKGVGVVFSKKS